MVKILHFADAHIDMANYGRHDPQSGLPLRVLDFLRALDAIVDAAINEKVDLVLFAGDTYRDRSPSPTFQREWGKRIMRLSHAGITTLLLIGNHDLSPATHRAHAVQEFDTLEVPHIHVLNKVTLLTPAQLEGKPVQVLALPWISRSGIMAAHEMSAMNMDEINNALSEKIKKRLDFHLEEADPQLPLILLAHTTVQGAIYGNERTVMLGNDLVLSPALVRNPRFDYVALGHIHKFQDLNPGNHPPVIYPGSIERVDFGEAKDEKYYVIADVKPGETNYQAHKIPGTRKFIDLRLELTSEQDMNEKILAVLPAPSVLEGAIVRLIVTYPSQWEGVINEVELKARTSMTFEFHLVKRALNDIRKRLQEGDKTASSMTPLELLDRYWEVSQIDEVERQTLKALAKNIMEEPEV